MTGLLHAHSGLRYLILLLAVANLVALAIGLAQKQPFGRLHRALGAAFAGSLHLQVVIGVVMVSLGLYYPKLIGHFAMMLLAAVLAQVTMSVNRRRPTPGYQLPLLGIGGALLLIIGGIMAISRGVLQSTAFGIGG